VEKEIWNASEFDNAQSRLFSRLNSRRPWVTATAGQMLVLQELARHAPLTVRKGVFVIAFLPLKMVEQIRLHILFQEAAGIIEESAGF
jgi:hypothetical protein